ncbi:MAG: VWA domain-containing protein [Acidobacteriota bacterium]|nr:VWA domain-containing protein [Acidobacteriota bacterium]
MTKRLALGAGLTVLGAVWPGIVGGQGPGAPSPLPGIFGEILDVRVVNIEVVVTDRSGIPVRGLSADDFRLLVDGREVPVDYFSEIRGGVVMDEEAGGAELLPGVPALGPGKAVGTSYLVFVDDFFSLATDRDRVLDTMIEDLPLLAPEDRMAVVAFDGSDLEMLSTWSQSAERLRRVLRDAKNRPARGLQRQVERRQFELASSPFESLVLTGAADGLPTFRTELGVDERAYVSRLSDQLNRSVAAAAATLRSFAKPPGRKVMVLLSGGWPFIPADFVVGDISRAIVDREGPFGDNLYRRLSETANLLGYTIYPVDLPGFNQSSVDVSRRTSLQTGAIESGFLREQEVHDTLRFLAQETGGRAMINAQRFDAFANAVADTRSFYWLGFSPARVWDDERHSVRVEVKNADFLVRSRRGFLDSSRHREVNMAIESSLLFGNSAGSATLEALVAEPVLAGRNRMSVVLQVAIPMDRVTFLPVDGGLATQLELRIGVVDEDGQQAEMPVIPLGLTSPTEPSPGARGNYESTLILRRKRHRVVVAIYDPLSGRILSTGLEIQPPNDRRNNRHP